jgi:hypothetical protein
MHNHSSRPTTVLVAGAGLVALILATVAVITLGGGNDRNTKTTRSPTGGESQRAAKGAPAAATLTAENVTFEDFYGVQLPISGTAGPRETAGGRGLAFAHSPDGAVLAAIHILYRAGASPGPAIFEPTIREQVVGVDKDKFLSKIQGDYAAAATAGTGPHGELAGTTEQAKAIQSGVWAYRLEAYDASVVPVQILLRSVPGARPLYVNMALTVKWIEGDWHLVAPLNGEFASASRQVAGVPDGYVILGRG